MASPRYKATLTVKHLILLLLGITTLLLAVNLIVIYNRYVIGSQYEIFWIFYFDAEANMPTLFSLFILLACAVFLWITAALKSVKTKRQTVFWKGLACVFLFMAIDEVAGVHETLIDDSRRVLGDFTADGYLHFAWVAPYSILFLLIFVFLLKDYLRLPNRTKIIFFIGGSIYLLGAVFFEMIGGRYVVKHLDSLNQSDLNYALIATVEELFEMVGTIIFLYGVIKFYLDNAENMEVGFQLSLSQQVKPLSKEEQSDMEQSTAGN